MKPPKSILDPTFRYTPAVKTDIRATFARVRREMAGKKPDAWLAVIDGKPCTIRSKS